VTALRDALSDYIDEVTLGAAPRTAEFMHRLREINQRNAVYFTATAAMLAIAFIVATSLVVFSAAGRTTAIAVLSVFGISIIGMVRAMLALWREKSAIELLVELAELDDDILHKVAAKLLRRLR
jgi:hypothetical protein